MHSVKLAGTIVLIGCCIDITTSVAVEREEPAWIAMHQQAVDRQRRVIFNNDGNEPVYLCKEVTAAELLRHRTAALAGSHVDAIFYCTWSSGFGMFTHDTKVGQVFNTREAMFENNRVQEFLDAGLDPLEIMAEFAHANSMELFWSMRMNDTHDGSRAEYGPVMFRANRLKNEHPEWLIGSIDKPPKYGSWSAVDYGVAEIRDLAFRYVEEVCRNYDVEGVELDFFRHAFFFKRSGRGEACGPEELNQMTGLLQRVRAMTEAEGRKRGRPILVAVRVPDSVAYCRFIGLDLNRWLDEGLVDLLVVSGYTQLNPWSYSVKLGQKYGVKVFPSLDEPRVRDEAARKLRASLPAYRGRALNAWSAGVDGIYMFNYFNPKSPLWREIGDPLTLRQLDRSYFASVRGPGHMPVPHHRFIHVPTLNPSQPIGVGPETTARVKFQIGENNAGADEKTGATLRLRFNELPERDQLRVRMNEHELSAGERHDVWLTITLPAGAIREGDNVVDISCKKQPERAVSLLDLYVEMDRAMKTSSR